ncbi:transcription initiation factor IIE subunit alpha-like isoform X2 [Salvia splendens]|uniref:transcription initiation factor IIE subunit alpha-like isoform X2 n=1 Tax=Salvia splendens TaxID=180675 RepID=UPI001C25FB2A|nr:transcription initiation factor IIE subunit alpha-like isoform X2 [Salvia splendens]
MASIDPFNRLVKLAARAFYDDITTKGENQQKTGRGDNRGIAVVVLDALTRRQWVREEDLAKDLKLHTKQLRRTLRFFEEEKLVARDHRKETAKGAKVYNAAVAATGDSQQAGREGDDKQKMHVHSYCCLDYAQIYDVVRYRLHRMKKKLKDELESKNTIQEYVCPTCGKRYTALDALQLITPYDEYFHCESCNGVLVAESDKLVIQDLGDGDDNARKHRHDKIKDMLSKMEVQLKPLIDQLARVKDLPIPEFGNLQAWEARAHAAGRSANGDLTASDPSKSSQGFGGTPMPYVGETKVEVAFSGIGEKGEMAKSETPMKVLPPWMIKDGMSLTKEQWGETKSEMKTDGTLTAPEVSDDKKSSTVNDEKKSIQEEPMNRPELANTISNEDYYTTTERQVGMKSKRDEDYEGDDVNWEEAAPTTGGQTRQFKVDLNEEAEVSEEEDDIDWEEG